jgi:hypothetical protein
MPRKTTHNIFAALNLTLDDHNYLSTDYFPEIDCMQESKFLLMYDLTENGALVDGDRLRIKVQFREAGGTWRDYSNGPLNVLYEEESTTPCNICVSGDCVGEKLRVVVTTDYTNADPTANYFIITCKITLCV